MSRTPDDDLASVRIDVEASDRSRDTHASSGSEETAGGPPTWIFAVAIVAALVVVGALVLLRPAGDEAADGTERIQPTTTVPIDESSTETTELTDQQPGVIDVNVGGVVSEMIEIDRGFLALEALVETAAPPLFRSVDGIGWSRPETVIVDVAGEALESPPISAWSELRRTNGTFSIVSERGGGFSTFVSVDGVAWRLDESDNAADSIPVDLIPLSEDEGSSLFVEILGDFDILDVLARHTSIDLDGFVPCTAFQEFEQGPALLASCDFEQRRVVEEDVTSTVPPVDVLTCLDALGARFDSVFRVVRVDPVTGVVEPAAGSEARHRFRFQAFEMADGTIAAIDPGSVTEGSRQFGFSPPILNECDGVVEPGPLVDASVVLIDPETLAVTKAPLPDVFQPVAIGFSPAFVGELTSETNAGSRLLVGAGTDLAALNVATGEWEVLDGTAPGPIDQFNIITAFSETARRVYRLSNELTIFGLTLEDDGSITTEQVTVSIADEGTSVVDGQILLATDDNVFFELLTQRGNTLQLLEIPDLGVLE